MNDPGKTVDWTPTREAGLARLEAFTPKMGRAYAAQRNFDLGPHDRSNISALSPWIRHRLISESEVLSAALGAHRFHDAEKFVQEVFWRGYFKGWLEQHPGVWVDYRDGLRDDLRALRDDHSLLSAYQAATQGDTGIDCFDAWARELREFGYLHNHARMWFASIWIFTLKLPWRLGADFLIRHLMDGDPASNTLSWRWVAGLHTKGKNYVARRDNIRRYANHRFDVNAGLALEPAPLQEDASIAVRQALKTPRTHVVSGDYGVIVTEEDCCGDMALLPEHPPSAVLVIGPLDRGSPAPLGEKAKAFVSGALDAGEKALVESFGVEARRVDPQNAAEQISQWAQSAALTTVVTAASPVGPVQDLITSTADRLNAAGVTLVRLSRDYDHMVWPHASKGFFALKKKIPFIINQLGMV